MGYLVIELTQDWDYVWMILIAAGVGAIGGFGGELLMSRGDNTGTVETPGRLTGTRFVDIGFPASHPRCHRCGGDSLLLSASRGDDHSRRERSRT
jgi:hypothetical protein